MIPNRNHPNKWRGSGIESPGLTLLRAGVPNAIVSFLLIDIRQPYCNVPVYPEDRILLGMRCKGDTSVARALPFVRSAPPHICSSC